MPPHHLLRVLLRAPLVACLMTLGSCVATGWRLPNYSDAELRPPEKQYAISYATGYGNFSYETAGQAGVGIGGSSVLAEEARKLFAETGFFTEAKEGLAPTGLQLVISASERSYECMWGIFVTSFTLFVLPAPVTTYEHRLEAELRRDGVLLQRFRYDEGAGLWFGIVCFPAFLTGQPFRAGHNVMGKMLRNLLHDLGQPDVLRRIEGA